MVEERKRIPPIHPGEILLEDYMKPLGITRYQLAKDLRVTNTRVYNLIKFEVPMTPDMAMRLSRYFGTTPGFWMNLQSLYDLRTLQMADPSAYEDIRPRPELADVRIIGLEEPAELLAV
jgi:addiction module HigA family antidote